MDETEKLNDDVNKGTNVAMFIAFQIYIPDTLPVIPVAFAKFQAVTSFCRNSNESFTNFELRFDMAVTYYHVVSGDANYQKQLLPFCFSQMPKETPVTVYLTGICSIATKES